MLTLGTTTYEDTTLIYDLGVSVSYGLWVCTECSAQFYGGGRALHNPGCTKDGYSNLEFHFGPTQITEVKTMASKYGKDHRWYGISLAMLKGQFPELL